MPAIERRATVLIRSGPVSDPDRRHLFVVMNDPGGPPRQVVIIGICSIGRGFHDATCELRQGDHPFIRHASYVDYRNARVEFADRLERGIALGEFVVRPPVSEEVFARIQAGVATSVFSKRFVRDFLGL